ncbi:NADH-quinone oxidoreductase subunit N [bacterium CG_4_9_14_3_um_filter_65_15]|nr:MAG: NADH-quinone oxidoreductase subunit N [bacterium CG_4_9_14_3_um_filter_65_15]
MELLNLNIPTWSDLGHWIPEAVLVGAFLAGLLGDLIVRGRRPWVPFAISVIGLVTAGSYAVAAMLHADPTAHSIMGRLVVVDGLATFFRLIFIFTGLVTVLFAWTSEEIMGRWRENKGEFYVLTTLMTLAMCVMAEARDLLMLFLSMEGVGLVSYVMAGYMRSTLRSTEASLKYVVFGAVSSAIMLYGLSLLYGMTGSLTFTGIRAGLMAHQPDPFGLLIAAVLILVGMSYKIAAVPFHYWAPDVYEGAPTPVSALFSVGPKAAGFALMIRFFYTVLASGNDPATGSTLIADFNWPLLVAVMSAATMIYANLVALRQTNVKRLLAYSSISHVGYILMGFVLLTGQGLQAVLFYLLVYTFMNLGAFFFVVAVNNHLKSEELEDYVGLGFRAPWAAAMMVVFLSSLAGVPPFAGFVGKLYIFTAVMDRQWFWLVIVAGVNSVIGLYYYYKVVKAMWLTRPAEGADTSPLKLHWLQYTVLGVLTVPTLVLGVYFGQFKALADQAIRLLSTGM